MAADVLLIVVGAAFVSVSPDSQRARRVINLLGASCFAGGLVVSKITSAKERDRKWLRARSRAEDIKSTAWRFMTAAQPYPLTVRNPDAVAAFQSAINRLNSTYGMHTSQTLDQEVTPAMLEVRAAPIAERLDVYVRARLDDQLTWYEGKAARSDRLAKYWSWGLFLSQAGALVAAGLTVWQPWLNGRPVFSALAGVSVGWLRATQYRELAMSYGDTARVLKEIRSRADAVSTDLDLNDVVVQVETTFAAERQGWAARRGIV